MPLSDDDLYRYLMYSMTFAKLRVMANRLQRTNDCYEIFEDHKLIMNGDSFVNPPSSNEDKLPINRTSFVSYCSDSLQANESRLIDKRSWVETACGVLYSKISSQTCLTELKNEHKNNDNDNSIFDIFGALTMTNPDDMDKLQQHCVNADREDVK